jgi:ribose transport system substrate-binding protein
MKKRKFLLPLMLCFLLLLTACANQSDTVAASLPTGSEKTDGTIDFGIYCGEQAALELTPKDDLESYTGLVGVIASSMRFPYGGGTMSMAKEALDTYFPNIDYVIGNGDGDPITQSEIIDDYIAKGIDVLVVDPVEKEAMVPAIDRARAAGVPVICIDRYVPTDMNLVIKADDVKIGTKAGEYLAEFLGGKGKVIEIQGAPSASNTNDRHQGFHEAIDGTDIEVIASPYADFLQATALSVMEDLLQRYADEEIDAIYSQSDVMTMGIIQALKAAGREIPIVSIDAQESALRAIKTGDIQAIVAYPIPMPAGVFAAAKALKGEYLPSYIELECPVITMENVDEYIGHSGY